MARTAAERAAAFGGVVADGELPGVRALDEGAVVEGVPVVREDDEVEGAAHACSREHKRGVADAMDVLQGSRGLGCSGGRAAECISAGISCGAPLMTGTMPSAA